MSGLPSGWAKATVGEITELNPKTEAANTTTVGFVPMQGLGTGFRSKLQFELRAWEQVKKAYTHFGDGDVLLAKITPCFENGKAGLAQGLPNGLGAGSSEFFVCRPRSNAVDPRYLLAWVSGDDFRARAAVQMSGSVGHKRVPKDFLLNEFLPLAPYKEQQRIADKLDTVLARVDACRDRLARFAPLLKRFRQSILAAATSGRLTEDWRTKHVNLDATTEIADWLATRSSRGEKTPTKPDFKHWSFDVPSGWAVASTHQFAECLDRLRVPIKRQDRKNVKGLYPYYGANGEVGRIDEYIFDDELVLVTEDETFYGREKPIAYRTSGRCWVNNHAHVLRARTRAANDYLCFSLMHYNVLPWLTGTTGRAKLTQRALNALPIAIPPNAELEEIVLRVETLFAFADRLEARLAKAQTAVERLTPSLMAKAFRGELVPQDPADEPAAELLARLGATSSSAASGTRKVRQRQPV